jgi:hypothetical protein
MAYGQPLRRPSGSSIFASCRSAPRRARLPTSPSNLPVTTRPALSQTSNNSAFAALLAARHGC